MADDPHARDLEHYFEYTNHGVHVIEDGLKEMTFGEFLVENRTITRFQLFRALQMQDRNPGVRLGECIAALGYLPYAEVEGLLQSWKGVDTVVLTRTDRRPRRPRSEPLSASRG
jgi:hypothetical protein